MPSAKKPDAVPIAKCSTGTDAEKGWHRKMEYREGEPFDSFDKSGAESDVQRDLSDRKKLILRAIVDAYISGGEPIGSKYLTRDGRISYSSATVRNEMAELEDMGYLVQPHTSAGRVPSERGYRFYVDTLMESYRMTAGELMELNRLAMARVAEMDKILDRASKLMSMMTGYASISARPAHGVSSVLQFRTVRLSDDMMLLVMVVESLGRHTAKTAYIPARDVSDTVIAQIEVQLNLCIAGRSVETITLPDIMKLRGGLDALGCGYMTDPIMEAIYSVTESGGEGELHLEGVNHLLRYQEYSDPERLGGFLESLEHKHDILDMVSRGESDGVNVYIGSENGVSSLNQSSLLFKKIKRGDKVVGAIGIIGPCRMKYNKVITMLEHFSRNITDMLDGE